MHVVLSDIIDDDDDPLLLPPLPASDWPSLMRDGRNKTSSSI
jgi:hypothetical protein